MTTRTAPLFPYATLFRSVTPCEASTIAIFLPASRLNSVDLPTLGRPTIATTGRMDMFFSSRPKRKSSGRSRNSSAPGAELPVLGQHIKRVVGDDGAQVAAVGQLRPRGDLPVERRQIGRAHV